MKASILGATHVVEAPTGRRAPAKRGNSSTAKKIQRKLGAMLLPSGLRGRIDQWGVGTLGGRLGQPVDLLETGRKGAKLSTFDGRASQETREFVRLGRA